MSDKPQIFCCVTLDVEVDKDLRYRISMPPSFRNVTEAIPELLEPLFLEFGVRPTYLLSSEVMQDRESVAVLKQLDSDHELGTHGHGELLDPAVDIRTFQGKPLHDFICDYPPEIQKAKLSWLTELFYNTFGYQPLSFRGGRFGVSGQTLKILQDLGYKVDSSVTPGLYWDNDIQAVNFIQAPEQPYHPDEHEVTKPGNLEIWEVPISSWEPSFWGQKVREWLATNRFGSRSLPEMGKKLLLKTVSRLRWLRPTNFSGDTLMRWAEEYINRHAHIRGGVVIIIMFHPIEMVPGASPYALTKAHIKQILANLNVLLAFLKKYQANFVTLSRLATYLNLNKV